jgi:hypothetical protein
MNFRYQIDRTYEMGLLAHLLAAQASKTVLLLEAASGYGKSLLLEQYLDRAHAELAAVAQIDLTAGGNSANGLLCDLCHQWGWEQFQSFAAVIRQMSQGSALDVNVRGVLQWGSPELRVVLPENLAQREVYVQALTQAWFEDVRRWLAGCGPALIVIDAYNVHGTVQAQPTVDQEFCGWLERAFLPQLVRTPALRLVLAGQQTPAHGLTPWERYCLRHNLGPITDPDPWMDFVREIGAVHVDRKTVSAFCHSENGHPYRIAMLLGTLCNWSYS